MATQGLLSMTRDGKVVVKIVTGADGYNITTLAESLRKNPTMDPYELLERCRQHDLGGNSLVIQTSPTEWLSGGDVDELSELYQSKFHDPQFNPRWEDGTAEYMEVAELELTAPPTSPTASDTVVRFRVREDNSYMFTVPLGQLPEGDSLEDRCANWFANILSPEDKAITVVCEDREIDILDGPELCRTCGAEYPEGGDGYDGECPACADRTYVELPEQLK